MYTVRTITADQEFKNTFTVVFTQKLKELAELNQQTDPELISKFSKKIKLMMKHFSGKFTTFTYSTTQ